MSRTRSTSEGSFSHLNTVYYEYQGVSSPAYETYSGSTRFKEITDVLTPGFHALKKCGKFLPLNPLVIETTTENRQPGTVDSYYAQGSPGQTRYYGTFMGSMTPTHVAPEPYDPDLLSEAALSAAAKASSAEWDVLTFMAELKKTTQTMSTIAQHFNRKTGQLAATAARYKKDPWRAFRELWLGARYSIRPMVFDYHDAAKAMKALARDILILEGKAGNSTSHADEWRVVTPTAYGNIEQWETVTQSLSYRGAAYCKYEKALNTSIQLDPLVTAWELVPYSFIVDWFINIGGWVQTLRPRLSGSFLGVQWSLREETVIQCGRRSNYTVYPYSGYFDEGTITKTLTKYTRDPTSVPFPPVVANLSLPKVIDLVTIFVGGKNRVVRTLNHDLTRKIPLLGGGWRKDKPGHHR